MRTEREQKRRWFHRKPKGSKPANSMGHEIPKVAEELRLPEAVIVRTEPMAAAMNRMLDEAAVAPSVPHDLAQRQGAAKPKRGRPLGQPNLKPDDPRVQERLNLWRQGLSCYVIGLELGLSAQSVKSTVDKFATGWDRAVRQRNIARRANEPKPDQPVREKHSRAVSRGRFRRSEGYVPPIPTVDWYVDAIDAWASGSTAKAVADGYGVTRERIRQIINEFATDQQLAEREQSLLAIRYLLDLKIEERNEKWQVEALDRKRRIAERRAGESKLNDHDLRVALINWCLAWRAAHPGEEGSIAAIMRWARETDPHKNHPRMQSAARIYFALGRWGYSYPNEFLTLIGVPNNGQVERIDSTPDGVCRRALLAYLATGQRTIRGYNEWRKLQEPKAPSRAVIEKHLCDRMGALIRNALEELDLKSDEGG